MKYPVCVHKDPDTGYGVTIPDIPGCFTAGDTLDQALANIQEAVQVHFHGQIGDPPVPSPMEKFLNDPVCQGGFWVLVEIDFSFLRVTTRRINVTIPENFLAEIDRKAKRCGLSRSAFLTEAALNYPG